MTQIADHADRLLKNINEMHMYNLPVEKRYQDNTHAIVNVVLLSLSQSQLSMTRNSLVSIVIAYLNLLNRISVLIQDALQNKIQYSALLLELETTYGHTFGKIKDLNLDQDEVSVCLTLLEAIDTDSLTWRNDKYEIDRLQYDTVIEARKNFYRRDLNLNYVSFLTFYKQNS